MVDDVKIEFMNVKDKDLVILNDFHFCTIDYNGDYEVEHTREHLREIIQLGIEKEAEIHKKKEDFRKRLNVAIEKDLKKRRGDE